MHISKAEEENLSGFKEDISIDDYDDHEIHIAEHTRYLLSSESEDVRKDPAKKEKAVSHLKKHKLALTVEKAV